MAEGLRYLQGVRLAASFTSSFVICPDGSGFGGRDYLGGCIFMYEPKKGAWMTPIDPELNSQPVMLSW